jgi:hypothetical protein
MLNDVNIWEVLLGWVAATAGLLTEEGLRRGFPAISAALARGLGKVAAWVCPSRSMEWMSEIANVQKSQCSGGRSALWLAISLLLHSPWIRIREWRYRVDQSAVGIADGVVVVSVRKVIKSSRKGGSGPGYGDLAGCCLPLTQQSIVAYGRRVHAADCPNLQRAQTMRPEKVRSAVWDPSTSSPALRVQGTCVQGTDEQTVATVAGEAGWDVESFCWLGAKHRGFIVEVAPSGLYSSSGLLTRNLSRAGIKHATVVGRSEVEIQAIR